MKFNKDYMNNQTKNILQIDSPTGFTTHACNYLKEEITKLGYSYKEMAKGGLIIDVEGKNSDYTIGVSAHIDTVGLMVRSINEDGTLNLTMLGGPLLPTMDGEYCTIYTRTNKKYTGTVLCNAPAVHVYPDAKTKERSIDQMIVRLDEIVHNKDDALKLDIQNGDYVAVESKVEITDNGFIKSRYLDDKIAVVILLETLRVLKEEKIVLPFNICILLNTYEEVGHGMSYIPSYINELLAIDMGCVGLDLAGNEYSVSICSKDALGPYDYQMTSKLIELAKDNNLPYAVDIYPFYSSDVSAALRGGNNIKGALFGPGIHASHGMERTHYQAVEATLELLFQYLNKEN